MRYAIQWLRSLLYLIIIYAMIPITGVVFFPWALASPKGAHAACRFYARFSCWLLGWIVGIKTESRGTPPTDEVLIAAKHQSFLDIVMIFREIPAGKFIMKRELMWIPIFGQYTMRIGCVPVDRGKRGKAIQKMIQDVERGRIEPGQLVIYPQGTRVAPGKEMPYKVGTAVLYAQLGQDCVPVATNAGVFWPRRGLYLTPGTAVVEFLPRIPAGLGRETFLARLESEIETASDRLVEEAGFQKEP
ncbi:lysophospholipid acyltransferase family protein [Litorisediminicola beolgyonensis]|uniref:Lysophospholipid acyltransferase family protein n=1 Tax=Litorisediminicola beolgyonensis TaxID=1173614 RepID=A0ABW3ZD06_9RHOB